MVEELPPLCNLDRCPLSQQEVMVLRKFKKARRLARLGHRVSMAVMLYEKGQACDITIEDRLRVAD